MPTLRSPDGRPYRTDDETEIRDLTLGRGYTVEPEQPAEPEPPAPRPWRSRPPATAEHDETDRDDTA